MSDSQVDRTLLFGVLALQMDFISRDALIAGIKSWVQNKSVPIGQILLEQGVIVAGERSLLSAVVEEQFTRASDDARHGYALAPLGSVKNDLQQIADPEVQAGVDRLVVRERSLAAEQSTLALGGKTAWMHSPQSGDRFELLRPHAWGGLGEVYLAYDRELNREVALKRLQERHAGSADSRIRFLAEAEITGGLEHPGIVPVYGMGMSDDGRPYYAMRFIRGRTLRDAIERFHAMAAKQDDKRRIELRQLLGRFLAVCNAVEYAHNRGVIHRDLKPNNIMLGKYGETLVVDWGLAKSIGSDEHSAETPPREEQPLVPKSGSGSSETLPGSAVGTPGYMSPEQAAGQIDQIGPPSDIFSLGVTLYVLLAGKEPFAARTAAEVIAKAQAGHFLSPRQCNPAVPAALSAICVKAMQRSPQDRYPSCAALSGDIERWLADEPVAALKEPLSTRLSRGIRRHRVLAASAAALAATAFVALVIGAALLGRANSQIAAEAREKETQRQLAVIRGDEAARERDEATRQRGAADRERAEATRQRDTANRQLYVSQMNLAQRAWEDNNTGRVQELLDSQMPDHTGGIDLRGWEWHRQWRLTHSALRTLNVQALCLAFSPDGKLLVSGGADGTLKIWSADGTRELRSIAAHKDRINVLAFSHNGNLLVTGCRDGTAKIWDPSTWREMRAITGHPTWEHGLAISPDGSRLAISFHTLALIEPSTGKLIGDLKGHTYHIAALTFTPDGSMLASGAWDWSVRLWDSATGRALRTFKPFNPSVTAVVVSPDGRTLFCGSSEGDLQSWDLASGKEQHRFQLHSSKITRLAFSPDGTRLASSSDDTTIKIWNVNSGYFVETLRGHASAVTDAAYSPGGDVLATTAWDSTIRLWDAASRQEPWWLRLPARGALSSIAYSPDGTRLAAGGPNATAVWDAVTGQLLWTAPDTLSSYPAGTGNGIRFSPDGHILASALLKGGVSLHDARDGRLLRTLEPTVAGDCASVDFSSDGRTLAAASAAGKIVLWNPHDGSRIKELPGHATSATCAVFNPSGQLLATAGSDKANENGRVRLWDVSSGRLLREFVGHEGVICSVVFSPDGSQLFTGGRDEMIRVWDVATGKMLRTHRGHSGDVQCLSISSDGKRLASASDDRSVKIWDVGTAQELLTFKPRSGPALSIAFNPDGTQLAAAFPDYWFVMVWDAKSLTEERRTGLDAASLVASLIPRAKSESDLRRQLLTRPVVQERVRIRALEMAGAAWQRHLADEASSRLRELLDRLLPPSKK